MMTKKANKKKVLSYVLTSFTGLIIISTLFIIISALVGVSKQGLPSLFGRTYLVVQTKSMEPEIKVHDLVINANVPFENIVENDIITFKCIDDTSLIYGEPITHRVIEKNLDGTLITKGDSNLIEDPLPVSKSNYIGKVVQISHFMGLIANVFTGESSFVLIIVAICFVGVMALTQIRSIILVRRKEAWETNKEKMLQDVKAKLIREEIYREIEEEERQNNLKKGN